MVELYKIECVVDTKEPWKVEKVGEYNLQSIMDLLKGAIGKKIRRGLNLLRSI